MFYFLLGIGFGAALLFALYLTVRSEYAQQEKARELLVKERVIILSFLHTLIDAVSQGVSKKQLYRLILHGSLMNTKGTSACFYENVPDAKQLVAVAYEGLFPLLKEKIPEGALRAEVLSLARQGEAFNYGEGIVGEVASTLKPVILEGEDVSYYVVRHFDDALKMQSLFVFPIYFRDELFGVLAIANSVYDPSLSKDTGDLLRVITEQAGMVLHNAKYLNYQIEKNRLDFDLNLASEVQALLFTKPNSHVAHCDFAVYCKSAQQIGGDFYDILHLDEHRTAFVIADVSGKGIAASLLMTMCITHLKHFAYLYDSPAAVLKELNRHLYLETSQEMFITMAYCIFDSQVQSLTIARAGHECPLLVPVEGPIQKLMPRGMGLGMVPNVLFDRQIQDVVYKFEKGDFCVLYTDGVTEALNAQKQEFSQQSLLKIVEENRHKCAQDLIQTLVTQVETFAGSKHLSDDLTVLVFRHVNEI